MTDHYLSAIESEIEDLKFGNPNQLYDPIKYIMQLGGKRIRPLICLATYSLFRNDWKNVLRQAVALEVFHNFTLMHDDIMDNAPLRRGQPTIHEKWGANTGILSGDVMFVKAYELFAEAHKDILPDILRAFNACAVAVCEGQQIDMNFEKEMTVSDEEYLEMIGKKTAALVGFSSELGGILSEQNNEVLEKLKAYGTSLGLAFQLTDDYLDVYGDIQKFGKQWGGDIISNKKTYLLVRALQKAEGEKLASLRSWISKESFNAHDKIRAIKSIYDSLEIKEDVEKKVNSYFETSDRILDEIGTPGPAKDFLKEFAQSLKSREK